MPTPTTPRSPNTEASLRQLHPALLVHAARVGGRRRLIAQAWTGRPPPVLNHPAALSALAALPGELEREAAVEAWLAAGVPDAAHDLLWRTLNEADLIVDASQNGWAWWSELGWSEA